MCQCQSSVLACDQKNIKVVTENMKVLIEIDALKEVIIDTKVFLKIKHVLKSVDKCKMEVSTLKQ